jgi:hypothetical protein
VRTLVSASANINVLSNVLMEPYQLKLISLYQKTKEDESKLSKKITVEEAIEQLHFKMKTSLVDDVERKVNVFLMENLE